MGGIIKRPEAVQDLEDIFVFIGNDNLEVAHRFEQAAESALNSSPKILELEVNAISRMLLIFVHGEFEDLKTTSFSSVLRRRA